MFSSSQDQWVDGEIASIRGDGSNIAVVYYPAPEMHHEKEVNLLDRSSIKAKLSPAKTISLEKSVSPQSSTPPKTKGSAKPTSHANMQQLAGVTSSIAMQGLSPKSEELKDAVKNLSCN